MPNAATDGAAAERTFRESSGRAVAAVAVAELRGPAEGLRLAGELDLGEYHLYHATRAELLRRLGRTAQAAAAYEAAIALAGNDAEREFLGRRRASLASEDTS